VGRSGAVNVRSTYTVPICAAVGLLAECELGLFAFAYPARGFSDSELESYVERLSHRRVQEDKASAANNTCLPCRHVILYRISYFRLQRSVIVVSGAAYANADVGIAPQGPTCA
jgi:hypothetical protein